MAMKRCPVCGEKYSDTYKNCPFCEEEAVLREGEKLRRGGRRAAHGRQYSLITPTLIILILIMAGLLVYLLYGDQIAKKLNGEKEPDSQQTEDVVNPVKPAQSGVDDEPDPDSAATGEPDGTDTPDTPDTPDTTTPAAAETDYEKASKLPEGLTLSTTDFTVKVQGEANTIRVSGGSGSYTWVSQDAKVASVDQNGTVTALSNGTVNIVVTDGSKKGTCIVRVNIPGGGQTTTTTTPATTTPSTGTGGSGLKAGTATVINGGNGVFVRSGPGTSYEALDTIPNGAEIQIVESAGDGWYKITYSGAGGASATGYMKGEFLQNK